MLPVPCGLPSRPLPLASPASAQSTPRHLRQLALSAQRLVVIGGGTGCNAVLSAFQDSVRTTFIVPISDDGGSTAEVLRVLGGPALGDIRSRLIRLIPASPPDSPLFCIRRLLEYRLPGSSKSHAEIKMEWHQIVEGSHKLWKGFNFKKASIGNLFLSGASLFLGSVPSAIFLFASLTGIPHDSFAVVPVINTSSTVTIAAELEDGTIIAGQSEISHPSPASPTRSTLSPATRAPSPAPSPTAAVFNPSTHLSPPSASFPLTRATTPSFPEPPVLGAEEEDNLRYPGSPDPNPNGANGDTRDESRNIEFSKDADETPPLEARIRRIFYLNAYGSEIFPRPNGLFLESLQTSTCLVYAPGSLYTSILPCLALRAVGDLIATSPSLQAKVLLLNSKLDRETPGYTALDFVRAITDACARAYGEEHRGKRAYEPRDVVTHIIHVKGGDVEVEKDALEALGIQLVGVGPLENAMFDDEVVREALERIFSSEA
ncbi:hypothetical protein JCM1840_004645 [Sporobolomyces johnsonii]